MKRHKARPVLEGIADGHLTVTANDGFHPHCDSAFTASDGSVIVVYFDGGPGLDYISRMTLPDGTTIEYEDLNGSSFWPDNEPWFGRLSEALWRAAGMEDAT